VVFAARLFRWFPSRMRLVRLRALGQQVEVWLEVSPNEKRKR
jgi:hypothetical protein